MELDKDDINYYEVLGCTIDTSQKDIERAVRKLSAKYHPDKNKSAEAEGLFLKVRQANDFLLDPEKRKSYDEKFRKLAKRKEYDEKRYKNMDSRRKRMREELEERLGSAQKPSSSAPSSSNDTPQTEKRRKKAELDRIRKDGLERVREASAKQHQQQETSIDEIAKKMRSREEEKAQQVVEEKDIYLQIKVKWKRSGESHSDDTLASSFRDFGPIEEISILPGKGASAVITFSEPDAAPAAVAAYESSKVFRVSIYGEPKKASIFTHVYSKSTVRGSGKAHFSNNSFLESDLMKEVRRTMERETLLKQLQDEESGGRSDSDRLTGVNNVNENYYSAHTNMSSDPSASVYSARDMPPGGSISLENLKKKEHDVLSSIARLQNLSTPCS